MLRGAIAAVSTPLSEGGVAVEVGVIAPYVEFLAAGGLDGVLALGTNGEGILLTVAERREVVEAFVTASAGRLAVAAHCGAQTTADSVTLAAHAAEAGADAVAVIGPPYFKIDPEAQRRHLLAVAEACAPTPFYVYEFAGAAGYPFDPQMLLRLREEAENVRGMKVSDTPWSAFETYLLDGFDVFVGPEALIHQGLEAGAVGAVSALAGSFPEVVVEAVREGTAEASERAGTLRAEIMRYPQQAALKRVLAARGVPIRPDVRAPLRDLTEAELASFQIWLEGAPLRKVDTAARQ